MKKIMAFLMAALLATAFLTACSGKCEVCGENSATQELTGISICDKCAGL